MTKLILNEDQNNALDKLKSFMKEDKQHMFLLSGAAGTGKTTTISEFIKWLHDEHIATNICMASPTHKALKVMRTMCHPSYQAAMNFSTMHSMLGMKHEITKDGKEVFIRDPKVMTKFPFYDFVIIDESSMIDDQLFQEMVSQNYNKIKVLFVGDHNQINPINHIMSIPMREEKRQEYNIGAVRLEKIVRQAEDNPIIRYSQKVIADTFEFKSGERDILPDQTGVVMVSVNQTSVLHQLINYYFNSEKFDKDADYCKLIAWRNVTVDHYNKLIRTFKYGLKASKIVVNEKLIVDKPIKGDDPRIILFNTNEDLEVRSIEIKEKKLYDNTVWKYYDCFVIGSENSEQIHILHEDDEIKYKKYLSEVSKAAVAEKDPGKRLSKWKSYYSIMENFSSVKYNYAITAHNSQGSTYDNCFVVSSDINVNRRDDERKRIMYTAFTRPRKMLYIM